MINSPRSIFISAIAIFSIASYASWTTWTEALTLSEQASVASSTANEQNTLTARAEELITSASITKSQISSAKPFSERIKSPGIRVLRISGDANHSSAHLEGSPDAIIALVEPSVTQLRLTPSPIASAGNNKSRYYSRSPRSNSIRAEFTLVPPSATPPPKDLDSIRLILAKYSAQQDARTLSSYPVPTDQTPHATINWVNLFRPSDLRNANLSSQMPIFLANASTNSAQQSSPDYIPTTGNSPEIIAALTGQPISSPAVAASSASPPNSPAFASTNERSSANDPNLVDYDAPLPPALAPYRYLGFVKGGKRGLSGIFKNESTGLILSIAAGDELDGWKLDRVDHEKAVLVSSELNTGQVTIRR